MASEIVTVKRIWCWIGWRIVSVQNSKMSSVTRLLSNDFKVKILSGLGSIILLGQHHLAWAYKTHYLSVWSARGCARARGRVCVLWESACVGRCDCQVYLSWGRREKVNGVFVACRWLSGHGKAFVYGCWEQPLKGAFWFRLRSRFCSVLITSLWPVS